MKLRQSLFVCLSLLVGAVACAEYTPSEGSTRESNDQKSRLKDLLNDIDAIRKKANVAGVGVAIVSRNEVIHVGGLGVQSLETRLPATESTLFRVGSITKSFVGLAALSMQRDDPDLFERPVNEVIPGLLDQKSGGDLVRLPHLLEHTAGLSDLSAREFAFQGETVTFEEAIKHDPATRKLRWQPAAHSSYSNAGYGFAGYMLESAAKKPFEELVHSHVLDPVGMNTAGFFITDRSPVLAAGYNTDGETPIPYWHMLYRSFGGLNATPTDMSQFVKALLQPAGPGQLFRTVAERKKFENPSTTLAAGAGLDYGYGLGNYHWFSNKLRFHGHGGDADGYLSHYGYSTEAGYGYYIVITAFNKKPLNRMREKVERYIASQPSTGLTPATRRSADTGESVALPGAVLSALEGDYVEVTKRFSPARSATEPVLRVAISGEQLLTTYRGVQHPLIATSLQHFRRPWQPHATYAFISTEDGDVYLQGDIGNFKRTGRVSE